MFCVFCFKTHFEMCIFRSVLAQLLAIRKHEEQFKEDLKESESKTTEKEGIKACDNDYRQQ